MPAELQVDVTPFGPDPGVVADLSERVLGHPLLREGRLVAYPPMPPLIQGDEVPGGGLERTLAVGLLPAEGERGHEIVGVNMTRRAVVRFDANAPFQAAAHNPICGLPNAAQPTAAQGTVGQAWVTVSQAGTVLWRFLVVRPAASSGTNGSGVELRFGDYKGKRVLHRAHVPILNVKYNGNACGPYLDWQWQEGMIQATGADVAPGFRLCPSPAQTIRLQRHVELVRVLGSPPPRLLAAGFRSPLRRQQPGPRVQRPAAVRVLQVAHQALRDAAAP